MSRRSSPPVVARVTKRRARPVIKVEDADHSAGASTSAHIDDVRLAVAKAGPPHYIAEARSYIVEFPAEKAKAAIGDYPKDALTMLEAGVIVLYQRCTHLGCRVPWCATSEWFECPCHNAKFDQIGEYRQGPAPRGLDLVRRRRSKTGTSCSTRARSSAACR